MNGFPVIGTVHQAAVPAPAPPSAAESMAVALGRILNPEAQVRWNGWLARDYTPERIEMVLRSALWGDHVAQWELFALMEDTWPRLGKALAELKRAVGQLDWRVEPWAEEDAAPSKEAEERARVVSRAIWTMRPRPEEAANGFEGTVFDLLDAWAKGVSVLEIEWEQRAAGAAGRPMLLPHSTHWVHPSHYAWGRDGRLGLRRSPDGRPVGAGAGAPDLEPFPEAKFLVAVCKARSGPALGGALLRPLAWWWCAANFSASWLLNLSQIFGLPIRWATYAPGADPALVAQICRMLENMGAAAWGAFPAGTQIELKEPGKGGGDWPQDSLLDRADRQADLLILGQTLTTTEGQSGTMALGSVHKGIRDEIVQAAADWAASVLNLQLVPAICRLNFGDEAEQPEFCPKPAESQDLKADADRICALLDRHVPIPRDWLYRKQQIPIPRPGEEVITGPEAAPDPGLGAPAGPGGASREQPAPAGESAIAGARAPSVAPRALDDTAGRIAAGRAAALAQAFRGALAPVRRLVDLSTSPEDLRRRLQEHYADWGPGRIGALVEEALQISAAAGAAEGVPVAGPLVNERPLHAYSPDQPRNEEGEWSDGGGSGGSSGSGGGSGGRGGGGKQSRKKLTIDQAAAGLAEKGWDLGDPQPWKPGQKKTVYKVTHRKTGKTVLKSADEIADFIG